jgi:hypothetical protein
MRMFETVVFVSVQQRIADFRNRSALLFDQVSEIRRPESVAAP